MPWPRNERGATAGLKTTSYAENVIALRAAHDAGADEALFVDTRGRVCEGTGSNVFYFVNGHLVTPSLATGCLAGVTRELVMELVDVMVADAPVGLLGGADEAFITSSTRDVLPVSHLDGHAFPACPGPDDRGHGGAGPPAGDDPRSLRPPDPVRPPTDQRGARRSTAARRRPTSSSVR